MLKKWKLSRAARLVRLRSTLRSKSLLAALVKTIHVPDPNIPLYLNDGHPNPEYDAYLCTLASVVMACSNLEALTGFVPFYNHTFDRLTHALSTRTKLRQQVWVIAENDDVRVRSQTQLPPGLLDDLQTYQFTLYHQRWEHLETLMLCSPGSLGVIEHELFLKVLHALPSLTNLCISSFDPDDFHDNTLLSLPSVTSLRLDECAGVTDAGLTRWAASPNAAQVQRLALLHQNVSSLLTLSKIFASLEHLTKFTIMQTEAVPSLASEPGVMVFQPVLAAKALKFLHWDLLCDEKMAREGRQTPNTHLALSITHGGFPSLTHLRAPRDTSPYGILQSVCEPKTAATADKIFDMLETQDISRSNSLRLARLRSEQVLSRPLNYRGEHYEPDARYSPRNSNHLDGGQVAQNPNSKASSSTVSSWETVIAFASSKSTNTTDTNPTTLVSRPISSEHGQVYSSGGDSDKEVVARARKPSQAAGTASNRESICQCEPTPTSNRDSICVCDVETLEAMRPRESGTLRRTIRRKPVASVSRPPPANIHAAAGHSSRNRRSTLSAADGRSNPLPSRPQPSRRPVFYLEPDVAGHDGNGGLVGWGELLRISEKAKLNIGKNRPLDGSEKIARGSTSDESSSDEAENEEHEEEEEDEEDSDVEGVCTGRWNYRAPDMGLPDDDIPLIKKILTSSSSLSSSTMSSSRERQGMATAGSSNSLPGRSKKAKSTSRLSLNLLRSSTKDKDKKKEDQELVDPRQLRSSTMRMRTRRHVARPRGFRGRCIVVEDFF